MLPDGAQRKKQKGREGQPDQHEAHNLAESSRSRRSRGARSHPLAAFGTLLCIIPHLGRTVRAVGGFVTEAGEIIRRRAIILVIDDAAIS